MSTATPSGRVVALSGGIGGAKLALGLSRVMNTKDLMIVANTGDDFEHLGLHISPDIDTLIYTLSGLANRTQGWGRRDETWTFMQALETLGGETWFKLGDGDLAMHVERTRRLKAGESLSGITADIAKRLGVEALVVPASDDPIRTRLRTADGWLDFQDYFVRRQCVPAIDGIRFDGADDARPNPALLKALAEPDLCAVVICPSNPLISVDPILAMPGLREALRACHAPVIAVSPIIAGNAVKGPTAKMMRELGMPVTPHSVAQHYTGLLDGYLVDLQDEGAIPLPDLAIRYAPLLMQTLEDREALAHIVLTFAEELSNARRMTAGGALD